jgi:phage baseplate assembly protein W
MMNMNFEREKLFGCDLRLFRRGSDPDLVHGEGSLDVKKNQEGDLDLAWGNDSIVQSLILRLHVRKGELAPLGWPDYGSRLYELIGEPNTTRTHAMLMAFARKAIEQDPRVSEVKNVQTQILPGERNVVRLTMEIVLISEPNPLNLVFNVNLEGL